MKKDRQDVYEWVGKTDLGYKIATEKYFQKGEAVDQFCNRVGGGNKEIEKLIKDKKVIFGGRIMANRGIDNGMSFSNCFRKDTRIVTDKGLRSIDSLVGKEFKVLDKTGTFVKAESKEFGVQELLKITLTNGKEIFATEDHIWFARNSRPTRDSNHYKEVFTKDLREGTLLKKIHNGRRNISVVNMCTFGVAHGMFFGDGSHNKKYNNLTLCGDKREFVKYFNNTGSITENEELDQTVISGLPNFINKIPTLKETKGYLLGFLAGYFATDGCLSENRAVITSTVIENLEIVNDILASLGVPTNEIKVHERVSNLTEKESRLYRLTLDVKSLPKWFFLNKNHILIETEENTFHNEKIRSVERTGIKETVYCAVVPSSQSFCLEGNILTHNCATQAYIKDSIEAIGDTQTELMKMYQAGQGVGLCLSNIRPKGAKAGRGENTTAGVVPFAKIFDNATENTMAGSSGRRGALLQTLSVEHPDALEFIAIKKKNEGFTGDLLSTNISMYVTDRFMEHYVNKESYRADYFVEDTGETIEHTVDTVKIMDAIIDIPKKAFDPALVFVDRFKYYHLFGNSVMTADMSQNGCNEMVGIDGATCLLATMVACNYVKNPFTKKAEFDYENFYKDVFEVIQEMDTILDEGIDRNPLEKQRIVAKEWRNLGLGITSLADCLIALGLKYGSDEAIEFTKELTMRMQGACIDASVYMGSTRGQSETILSMEKEMEEKGLQYIKGLRNCALMAHAPSGTGSTMLGYSTGIEPVFRSEYTRSVTKDGVRGEYDTFTIKHPQIQKCIDNGGDIEACVDSREISPLSKVKMLESIQKYTDMCSSNTTNLKEDVSCDEIKDMYIEAWKRGVTSMSIYVDGSLDGVLNDIKEEELDTYPVLERGIMSEVPSDTYYIPKKITHGCGEMKVMIGYSQSESRVTDCYVIPKMGSGCTKNITGEAILISQVLRLGGDLRDIKESVKGIEGCNSCVSSRMRGRAVDGINCPNILIDAIISVQDNMGGEFKSVNIKKEVSKPKPKSTSAIIESKKCPDCGGELASIGGCQQCYDCGYSHCH